MIPRERSNVAESPPLACGAVITHSSQMDFVQFTELFRSFLVRSRKDLRQVFEQVAVSSKVLPESHSSDSPDVQEAARSKRLLGKKANIYFYFNTLMRYFLILVVLST